MSVDIEVIKDDSKEKWNKAVQRSPQTMPFHEYDVLSILGRHFDAIVHPLMGYVGQEPIGVFPVFEQSKGPLSMAISPPLNVEISTGPALVNDKGMKQRKAEKRHQSFIEGCLDWIERHIGPNYTRISAPPQYTDARPFLQREFVVELFYTYLIDLTNDLDELKQQFSSGARKKIRNTPDEACEIREGGVEEIEEIISIMRQRFDDLNLIHYIDTIAKDLITDLYSANSIQIRPYTARVDGETVSGVIAIEDDDTVYRWLGGAKASGNIPATELMDWQIMRDAKQHDKTRYDLVGANLPQLCEYKAKFNPDVYPHYVLKKQTLPVKVAERTYYKMPHSIQEMIGI